MATRPAARDDWTIARLHDLPGDGNRYEIVDGVLYVTPSPGVAHQWALSLLFQMLSPYARSVGLDIMWSPADIQYSERTVVQPDIFAFVHRPGMSGRSWADVHPLVLVVEALSRSTRRRDRTIKRELYQSQRIDEYWIVDADRRTIERWRPDAADAEVAHDWLDWQPVAAHDPLRIDVGAYFRTYATDGRVVKDTRMKPPAR